MNYLTVFIVIFAVVGAIDRIFGNRFGFGEKFEKGFMLLGNMALSMIGMIIISPFIADIIKPILIYVEKYIGLDPSILPSILFAIDMGGAPLSVQVASNADIGMFNALVVSSMMGTTISFTLPYALGVINPEKHKNLFLGFLCGIATIPVGCFVSGLMLKTPVIPLIIDLIPIIIFAVLITIGLLKCPNVCIKIFQGIGIFMKTIITIGLTLGVIHFLTGISIIKNLDTLENGAKICVNASVVMCGMFPFVYGFSKLVSKPANKLGKRLNINETSVVGLISNIASNATTFELFDGMDDKGIVINSAFAVSAAFTFGSHLAFTMAFNAEYILPVIIGKLVAGIVSIIVAAFIYKKVGKLVLN